VTTSIVARGLINPKTTSELAKHNADPGPPAINAATKRPRGDNGPIAYTPRYTGR